MQLLHRRRRGKDEGKEVKPERDAEPGAEHAAEQEDDQAAEKSAHVKPQSALGRRRMVNSMRSPGSSRQDSIAVM